MKKITLFIITALLAANCFSQIPETNRALALIQAKDYGAARKCIDSCMNNGKCSYYAAAWLQKGYACKGVYATSEKATKESPARIAALESFKKSMELDTAKANTDENKRNIKF